MNKPKFLIFMSLALALVALQWGIDQASAQSPCTNNAATITTSPSSICTSPTAPALGVPGISFTGQDYTYSYYNLSPAPPSVVINDPTGFGAAAVATVSGGAITGVTVTAGGSGYSATPTVTIVGGGGTGGTCLATVGTVNLVPGVITAIACPAGSSYSSGMRKFVDALSVPPIAVPDTTTYSGADYYELQLQDYKQQLHTDLPATGTHLRGYAQTNNTPIGGTQGQAAYFGPIIIAQSDGRAGTPTARPVRIKFSNSGLTTDLSSFMPVDDTIMGAGQGTLTAAGTFCNWWTGLDAKGNPCTAASYSNNRANLHLHGGFNPWISDGTPHTWTSPAGYAGPYFKGASFQNVPDMVVGTNCAGGAKCITPTPSDGVATYFYPNQQSGRLQFYHDHAYGITRLNVYAGEAAGYLMHDPTEDAQIQAGAIPTGGGTFAATNPLSWGMPLVIQDKSFVSNTTPLEDPLWSAPSAAGGLGIPQNLGDLWFPHVYVTNQFLTTGAMTSMGRWDYAPWVVPPGVIWNKNLPNPSIVPEAFVDTPVVNGKAYPVMQVTPSAYRFRILNIANDRWFNMQLYYASDRTSAQTRSIGEVISFANVCTTQANLNAIFAGQTIIPVASAGGIGANLAPVCSEVNMVPANGARYTFTSPYAYQTDSKVANTVATRYIPFDGRNGGVPDPRLAGPPFIQIGNDGGLLRNAAVIQQTPIDYDYNRKDITFGNIRDIPISYPVCPQPGCTMGLGYTLLLGPAERADVIIDFSSVPAGSTLILYSDAPNANPGYDPRNDYYTGANDLSAFGGAPPPAPGYGPNIRTIMAFQVVAAGTAGVAAGGPAVTPSTLSTTIATIFGTQQPAPIVPDCNPAVPQSCGNAQMCQFGTICLGGVTTFPPCSGPGSPASPVQGVNCGFPVMLKSIAEDFDPIFGRMNAMLGTEQASLNSQGQQTFGFKFVDPVTENLNPGQTQIWSVVHNGVDTHSIHVHLFNVQIINRVGWDGIIRPPDPQEMGWKEVMHMLPLENTIFAFRPSIPLLPFPIPTSSRLPDVTSPLGWTDPTAAQALFPFTFQFNATTAPNSINGCVTQGNQLGNCDYGWEYVWHCHLLGHEENDMMRPLVISNATNYLQLSAPVLTGNVVLKPLDTFLGWTTVSGPASKYITGWTFQRDTVNTFNSANLTQTNVTPFSTLTYQDKQISSKVPTYYYRIAASGSAMGPWSNTLSCSTVTGVCQ